MNKKIKWIGRVLVIALVAGCSIAIVQLKPLLTVGSSYAAKIVCSNVFLAGRDYSQIMADDVQAPGHPLLKILSASLDLEAKLVSVSAFGLGWAGGQSVYRDGYGCTNLPAGIDAPVLLPPAMQIVKSGNPDALWPEGESVQLNNESTITDLIDEAMQNPGTRAIIVVKNGRIIGEAYGNGFDENTPLLGWSMAKTVTAALAGVAVKNGFTDLEESALVGHWSADSRISITLENLLHMESGLNFNESYGSVSDVTRMLYLEPDFASFSANKELQWPIGEKFNYSSGTTNIIARHLQERFESVEPAHIFRAGLFNPLGMESAVMEMDAAGTLAGSSYLYATARDWARFGLFLSQDGVWHGKQILPKGWVKTMRTPSIASDGNYGLHVWLKLWNASREYDLPDDVFWMSGHDGQSIAIVPSKNLVVVRLGLTPSHLGFQPQVLVEKLVARN